MEPFPTFFKKSGFSISRVYILIERFKFENMVLQILVEFYGYIKEGYLVKTKKWLK
jgi:hypothetical protein